MQITRILLSLRVFETIYEYMVFDGLENGDYYDSAVKLMPLTKRGNIIKRTYCAFWKVDNSGYYVETFAELFISDYGVAVGSPAKVIKYLNTDEQKE